MVLPEERDLLYALRTMEVMMSSGIGLEAALLNLSQGGYGKITSDFSKALEAVGKGKPLDAELSRMMTKTKSKPYRKFITTLYNNVTKNTDVVDDLRKQGDSEETSRSDKVEKYIEALGGLPETLLSIGMTSPLILSILGLFPQLMGDLQFIDVPDQGTIMAVVNGGLAFTAFGMAMVGIKAHTKDPGL